MKTKFLIGAILLVAATFVRAATNDLSGVFQQGLFEEEANRNLDAAIQAYQSVATRFDKDRQLAATAIFRLGECYRKLGKTNEAVVQYDRIVREFPDQQTLTTLSRQNLLGIGAKAEALVLPTLNRAARMEQKRLLEEEIKLTEQDLVDVKKRVETGRATQQDLRDKEREILQLRRQSAGLNVGAEESSLGKTTVVIDDEEKEIRRIQVMIQDSPDRINASVGEGPPLNVAAGRGQLRVAKFLLDHGANPDAKFLGATPLHAAALNGHKAMVELLLERGAKVDGRDDANGDTALHIAAENGFQSVAEVLLQHKADINSRNGSDSADQTPLHRAIAQGQPAMVAFLISKGAKLDAERGHGGATAVLLAAMSGTTDVLDKLLKAGAKPDIADDSGRTAVIFAAERGHLESVKALLAAKANPDVADKNGRTALSYAVEHQNTEVMKALLASRANPNAGLSDSPLLLSVRADNPTLAELLLRADANPNQVTGCKEVAEIRKADGTISRGYSRKQTMRTPLQAAVQEEYPAMVKLLMQFKGDPKAKYASGYPLVLGALNNAEMLKAFLDAGADPNAKNAEGKTLLMASIDKPEILRLLLEYKADVNAKDKDGFTPLQRAVLNKTEEIIEMLLDAGANPNVAYEGDHSGKTPLHWAAQNQSKKIVELLIGHKANVNVQDMSGDTPLDFAKRAQGPGGLGTGKEIADLLYQHGALDDLPDFSSIRITRGTLKPILVFSKDANSLNHFTLLEAIERYYNSVYSGSGGMPIGALTSFSDRLNAMTAGAVGNPLRFPDFSRITIYRPTSGKVGERKELTVNILSATNTIDCSKDVPLEFGDVIEIPEREHTLAEQAITLTEQQKQDLHKCSERKVRFVVRGETTEIAVVGEAFLASVLQFPQVQKILRSSSDLARLKVKRTDPKTGKTQEIPMGTADRQLKDDLWLRDGDVIEVPDKP